MTDEIKMPHEGMSTLVTQYTKHELDRLGKVIANLRAKGETEEKILALMQQQLKRFDPHSLMRIYQRSLGTPIPDDFAAENVVAEREVKPNTLELTVKELMPHLDQQALVLYKGQEWFVQWVEEKKYTIKRVL